MYRYAPALLLSAFVAILFITPAAPAKKDEEPPRDPLIVLDELLPKLATKVAKLLADNNRPKELTVKWDYLGVPNLKLAERGYKSKFDLALNRAKLERVGEGSKNVLSITLIPDQEKKIAVKRISYRLTDDDDKEIAKIEDVALVYPFGKDPKPQQVLTGNLGGVSSQTSDPPTAEPAVTITEEGRRLRLRSEPYALEVLVDGQPLKFDWKTFGKTKTPILPIPVGKPFQLVSYSYEDSERAGAKVFLDGLSAFELSEQKCDHFLLGKAKSPTDPSMHKVVGYFINTKTSMEFKLGKLKEAEGLPADKKLLFERLNQTASEGSDDEMGVIAVHFHRSYPSLAELQRKETVNLADPNHREQVIPGEKVNTNYTMVESHLGKRRGIIAFRYVPVK